MNIIFTTVTSKTMKELLEELAEDAGNIDRDLVVGRENRMVLKVEDESIVYSLLDADGVYATWQYSGSRESFMKAGSIPAAVASVDVSVEVGVVHGTYGSVVGKDALARYDAKETAAKAKFIDLASDILSKASAWMDGLEARFASRA